jgi:hypothetical protein
MTATRLMLTSCAILASIAAGLVIGRRRHRASTAAASERNTEWTLVDDFTQAAANALPDESGAFRTT